MQCSLGAQQSWEYIKSANIRENVRKTEDEDD
jgi:hypothetical protein